MNDDSQFWGELGACTKHHLSHTAIIEKSLSLELVVAILVLWYVSMRSIIKYKRICLLKWWVHVYLYGYSEFV